VSVQGEHILISIILFAVIYALLFVVWLTILDRKIKTGPEDEYSEVDGAPKHRGWIDAAALLAAPNGKAVTDSSGGPQKTGGE
jgi:hypothetical protein